MTTSRELFDELLHADIAAVANTKEGARLLRWVVFDVCGLEQPSWAPDALTMSLNEGKRVVGREIVNELRRIDAEVGEGLFRKVYDTRFERAVVDKEQG